MRSSFSLPDFAGRIFLCAHLISCNVCAQSMRFCFQQQHHLWCALQQKCFGQVRLRNHLVFSRATISNCSLPAVATCAHTFTLFAVSIIEWVLAAYTDFLQIPIYCMQWVTWYLFSGFMCSLIWWWRFIWDIISLHVICASFCSSEKENTQNCFETLFVWLHF